MGTTTTKKSKHEINNELPSFTGSSEFFRYKTPFANFIFTEGINYVIEECQAFWMLDIIASYQFHESVKGESFQVYEFAMKDGKADLSITDGNKNVLATQHIPFTDFPLDSITLWFIDGTALLPSEY